MVCKECGAYNAEHLTHCRICAAKLKDEENIDMENDMNDKPEMKFTKMPSWPERAYSGASDPKPLEDDTDREASVPPTEVNPGETRRFVMDHKTDNDSVSQNVVCFCTTCGKPLIPGAAFCPFCGTKINSSSEKDAYSEKATYVPSDADKNNQFKKNGSVSDNTSYDDDFDDDIDDDEEDDVEEVTPKKKGLFSKKPKKVEYEDDFDDEEDFDDEDEPDDDEYNDDYYDQEFDDEEDDGKKKKGSTILFIVLIVILLLLIAFFGTYIVKKNGGFNNLVAKIKGNDTAQTTSQTTNTNVVTTNDIVSSNEVSATIEDDEIDGIEMFLITIQAPNESLVKIVTKADLEQDTVEVTKDNQVAIRLPRIVFLSGNYCDSMTETVTPQLEVTLPDGTQKQIDLPASTVTVPQVSLKITEPEGVTVEASKDGSPIRISGEVTDHLCEVTVNGDPVTVVEGGVFSYDYTPTQAEDQVINIVAKKANQMTNSQTITVTPYVVKDLEIVLTNELSSLTASDNKVTLTGTCPAGSTIVASSDNTNAVCSEVVVSGTSFTCPVTVSEEGVYTIRLDGVCDGYNDGYTETIVECRSKYKSDSSYQSKAVNLNKKYDLAVEGKTSSNMVYFQGKIKEIVSTDPYTVFILEDTSGNVVYVCNRSLKSEVTDKKIGKKVMAIGYLNGLYTGTSCPYIWSWWLRNK